jgi:SAM-dependent methyltransferase
MVDELRRTFGQDAELYDQARPRYAAAVFDDLARLAGLGPGARVLEIGCGTGIATLPLAQRGYHITAVELSTDLATVARRKLLPFGDQVHIEVDTFESWPLPREPFDAVISAQALHWVEPAIRLVKSAAALEPEGCLAVFGHLHVGGGDRQFFAEVQDCYERLMPGTPPGLRLIDLEDLPYENWGFEESGLFEVVGASRYPFEVEYTAAEYLAVLNTYSGHRALQPDLQAQLYECIERLIQRFGGRIRKAYATELIVARKISSS